MCGCEFNFVCGLCRGDLKQDWRMLFEPDPAEFEEERLESTRREDFRDQLGFAITRSTR